MKPRSFLRIAQLPLLGLGLFCLLAPQPALALPGHTVFQIKQWATQSTFLLQLQEGKDAEGNGVYSTERKTGKGSTIKFQAIARKNAPDQVYSESLSILASEEEVRGKNLPDYFKNNHRKIFQPLVDLIYGSALTLDYENIELDVFSESNEQTQYFYRGRKYGYLLNWQTRSPDCAGSCKAHFELKIYDLKDYQLLVESERNRQKSQPVNLNLFPG